MNENAEDSFRKAEYRYERKFVITGLSKYEVESIVKLHPALFSETYCPRFVNNIYFDSFNLKSFYANIYGATNKRKIRVRWYGDLLGDINNPLFEVKMKIGMLVQKTSIPMTSFELKKNDKISDILHSADILEIDSKTLEPALLNRYSRKYYQSCDGNYRLTMDMDQEFYQISNHSNSFLNRIQDKETVILELKYNQAYDSQVSNITTHFPFRITKSSKYVNGVQRVSQYSEAVVF